MDYLEVSCWDSKYLSFMVTLLLFISSLIPVFLLVAFILDPNFMAALYRLLIWKEILEWKSGGIFFVVFWSHCVAGRILSFPNYTQLNQCVSCTEAWSLNHWPQGKSLRRDIFKENICLENKNQKSKYEKFLIW